MNIAKLDESSIKNSKKLIRRVVQAGRIITNLTYSGETCVPPKP